MTSAPEDAGSPTVALVGAAGAAVAGVMLTTALQALGARFGSALLGGGVLGLLAAVGGTRWRSRAAGDLGLAALATVAFSVVLWLLRLFILFALVGGDAMPN